MIETKGGEMVTPVLLVPMNFARKFMRALARPSGG
jgi:hypothetical protein